MNTLTTPHAPATAPTPIAATPNSASCETAYQAPAIESVVSSDDLQREVLYAGSGLISDPDVPEFPL